MPNAFPPLLYTPLKYPEYPSFTEFNPADGVRSVHNACRTADDVYLRNAERLYRDGVCGIERRYIARTQAVLQHQRVIIVKSADNGAGGRRPHPADRDAGHI